MGYVYSVKCRTGGKIHASSWTLLCLWSVLELIVCVCVSQGPDQSVKVVRGSHHRRRAPGPHTAGPEGEIINTHPHKHTAHTHTQSVTAAPQPCVWAVQNASAPGGMSRYSNMGACSCPSSLHVLSARGSAMAWVSTNSHNALFSWLTLMLHSHLSSRVFPSKCIILSENTWLMTGEMVFWLSSLRKTSYYQCVSTNCRWTVVNGLTNPPSPRPASTSSSTSSRPGDSSHWLLAVRMRRSSAAVSTSSSCPSASSCPRRTRAPALSPRHRCVRVCVCVRESEEGLFK